MGEETNLANLRLTDPNTKEYPNDIQMNNNEFSIELNILFDKYKKSGSEIASITKISKTYINDLKNIAKNSEHKFKVSRDKIIRICVALGSTVEETNKILRLCNLSDLYSRDRQESIIIFGMSKNMTYYDISNLLYEQGFQSNILEDK